MTLKRPEKDQVERLFVPFDELRVTGDSGSAPKIEGYAAVFGPLSVNLGGFQERVRVGAFAKTIQESDIRGLFNHDPNFVLGRNKSGTMELREDPKGLWFRVDPPKAAWADGLVESIRRGDIDQCSFSFRTLKDEWGEEDDRTVRTLVEVRLFDVGPVTFPAYEATIAQVRSVEFAEHEGRRRMSANRRRLELESKF